VIRGASPLSPALRSGIVAVLALKLALAASGLPHGLAGRETVVLANAQHS